MSSPFPGPASKVDKKRMAIIERLMNWPLLPATGNPTNARHITHKAYVDAATLDKNFFGDGSDGALSTTGNVTFTSTLDGAPVVKQYTSLKINAGHTMTVSNRCKGLIIYVQNDLEISGTLSMSAKGASAAGANVIIKRYAQLTGDSSVISTEAGQVTNVFTDFTIPATGATGGSSATNANGNAGTNGTGRQCGGGGSGAGGDANDTGGAGGAGTSFSGGPGGGGAADSGGAPTGGTGATNGGAGGNGATAGGGQGAAGGGAGNGGGTGAQTGAGMTGSAGQSGTGGLIILIVGGNILINVGGLIEADGRIGGNATGSGAGIAAGGGGSGGGSINPFYGGTYTNNGTVRANGGQGGTASGAATNRNGGAGGNGTVTPTKIVAKAI